MCVAFADFHESLLLTGAFKLCQASRAAAVHPAAPDNLVCSASCRQQATAAANSDQAADKQHEEQQQQQQQKRQSRHAHAPAAASVSLPPPQQREAVPAGPGCVVRLLASATRQDVQHVLQATPGSVQEFLVHVFKAITSLLELAKRSWPAADGRDVSPGCGSGARNSNAGTGRAAAAAAAAGSASRISQQAVAAAAAVAAQIRWTGAQILQAPVPPQIPPAATQTVAALLLLLLLLLRLTV
jgi:hypothetical protein